MRRASLASRVALVTTGVAAMAVIVAGGVSNGLVRSAAETEARRQLARQADVVAELLERPAGRPGRILDLLRPQQIVLIRVGPDGVGLGPQAEALSVDEASRLAAGGSLSAVRTVRGRRYFVEGRPLSTPRGAVAIALVQPASQAGGVATPVVRRLVIALLIGLAAAAVAGVLLAGRLARPLQQAAGTAHRMAAGVRGERLTPDGPREVADVAESLNALAAALETSEGRQRDFLLSVSHELRTPLTAITGFAEALADGVTPARATRDTGGVIRAEAARLERIVSDLLDLSRLGAQDFRIDPAPVDLAALAADAATVWTVRCEREGVPFSVDTPATPVVVTTDGGRVRQIVDGLLENALRVTPSGRPILLAVRAGDTSAVVEVRDGGPGLTPDDCAVAFERSALYDRYRGVRQVGTGVGLALVAGLARRLGGRAEAGVAAEGGARFTVTLPVRSPV